MSRVDELVERYETIIGLYRELEAACWVICHEIETGNLLGEIVSKIHEKRNLVEWIKREKDELDQLKESLLNESPSLSYEDHKRLIEVESLFLEAAAAGHKARASAVYLQTLSE